MPIELESGRRLDRRTYVRKYEIKNGENAVQKDDVIMLQA